MRSVIRSLYRGAFSAKPCRYPYTFLYTDMMVLIRKNLTPHGPRQCSSRLPSEPSIRSLPPSLMLQNQTEKRTGTLTNRDSKRHEILSGFAVGCIFARFSLTKDFDYRSCLHPLPHSLPLYQIFPSPRRPHLRVMVLRDLDWTSYLLARPRRCRHQHRDGLSLCRILAKAK